MNKPLSKYNIKIVPRDQKYYIVVNYRFIECFNTDYEAAACMKQMQMLPDEDIASILKSKTIKNKIRRLNK